MILFVNFIYFVVLTTFSLVQDNKIYSYLNLTDVNADSLQIIPLRLAERWLQAFKDTSDEKFILTEYKILKISQPYLYNDSLDYVNWDSSEMTWKKLIEGKTMITRINYSVKPKINNFNWRAGNGRWNEKTGWVTNKSGFLWIRRSKNKIVLYKHGTGF